MPASASSALVNVAEDAELRLVRLLADSAHSTRAGFVQDCEACILHGDAAQLMRTILEEKGAISALVSLEEEAVSAVSLLAALLDRVKEVNSSKLVDDLADSVIQSTSNEETSKAVSLLATLYNMRSEPLEKVGLLVKMIDLATARQPALLESSSSFLGRWMEASKLSSMLDDWQVEPVNRRALYRAAASGTTSSLSEQRFTLLTIETYSESDVDAEALESAKKAAIGAIRDPVSLFVEQRKILSLPAIQALKENFAPLLDLLRVFQEGKLEDYQSFVKTNGGESVLAQWELSPAECTRHIRILSLCSLAAEHEEIPYSIVANTLQTESSDVEKWVIAAVSSGLLSAKMDQLQEQVIVERCVVRKFEMEQWKGLQSRLHLWKKNVGGILEAYKQSQQQKQ
mmetsp:Transcript_44365/g.106898  ORF Transcript_44365/g.106898 Transcript_44365/m.106898 type:complete len:400 (-) Transcript_44365:100-1299(-)